MEGATYREAKEVVGERNGGERIFAGLDARVEPRERSDALKHVRSCSRIDVQGARRRV